MEPAHRPTLGQVVLIEGGITDFEQRPVTGVIAGVGADKIVISLSGNASPPRDGTTVVAARFAREALYRLTATAHTSQPGFLVLEDCDDLETVQRRRWPRCAAHLPVSLVPVDEAGGAGVCGETIDVGVGGAFVHTPSSVPFGSDLLVALTLAAGDTMVLAARVVSCERHRNEYECRLAFCEPDDVEVGRLDQLVRSAGAQLHSC